MAPLVAFSIGAFAVYNVYRYFWREWARANDILNEQMHGNPGKDEPVELVKDPVTGEYRVKD